MKPPVKNILVLTYWSFEDALIQTYTLPYLRILLNSLPAGSKIYLLTLEKNSIQTHGVSSCPSIVHLPFRYLPFGLSASLDWIKNLIRLKKLVKQLQVSYIHAFCTPAGMIGYLLARISRKPLVLDSYEPHAEAMVENGEWAKSSWSYKILFYFEKKQSHYAQHIIAATKAMRQYAAEKYKVSLPNMSAKPACVDLEKFNLGKRKNPQLLKELQLQDRIVGVYAGKFGGIYLKEEVFAFYKACYSHWGDKFAALILTSHTSAEIMALAAAAGVPESVFHIRFVPHAQIPDYIGLGDFALTPVKPVPTKKYCTPIKNGEYWALGLPVIITKDISTDSDLIQQNNFGYVLEKLDLQEYEKAVTHIDGLIQNGGLPEKIRAMAERERNYSMVQAIYDSVYSS